MTSYAEIASKIPLPVSLARKARDSMESLGTIRRSPSRRDHFKVPPQMEDSVLLSEELPTCNVEKLLDASTPSTTPDYYTMMEEFELQIIKDEDEAAAILDGGKTWDLPITIGSGNVELPGNSQGVMDLTGNSPSQRVTRLPRNSPVDLEKDHGTPQQNNSSPISTTREWDTVKRKTRKSRTTSNPAFEDIIEEPPQTNSHKGIEWVFLTISTSARSASQQPESGIQ